MSKTRNLILASMLVLTGSTVMADIPLDYYKSLQGLSGRELKDAIHVLLSNNVDMLSYGSGEGKTWSGFYQTDRRADNSVVDRYCYEKHYFSAANTAPSGMNIEHSFPKSWWGGSSNNAYKDLFNLMPSESTINSAKSNYGMNYVVAGTEVKNGDNGCTRVGKDSNGNYCWEPADEWKGDFARGFMYMATTYQDFTWSGEQALLWLTNDSWTTLKSNTAALLLEWAKTDQVDELEITRNAKVQQIQGNRNPFVDFPNLREYVWGDSISRPFDLLTTLKAGAHVGGDDIDPINPNPAEPELLFSSSLMGDEAGFTVEHKVYPSFNVWRNSEAYGWTGSGYNNGANEADATLVSPEFDLSNYQSATLTFEHAVNYCSSPSSYLEVGVRDASGAETYLSGVNWPAGNNWTFVESGNIDLTGSAGKKIKLLFHYTSSESVAGTWEIKNMELSATPKVGQSQIIEIHDDLPVEYFDLTGKRVQNPETFRGILIRRQGGKARKIAM